MPYFEASASHYFDSIKIATVELLERLNTEIEKLRIEDGNGTRVTAYNSALDDVKKLVNNLFGEVRDY